MINEQIAEIKERYDYLQKYVVITNKVKESLADIPVLISALEEAEQKAERLNRAYEKAMKGNYERFKEAE